MTFPPFFPASRSRGATTYCSVLYCLSAGRIDSSSAWSLETIERRSVKTSLISPGGDWRRKSDAAESRVERSDDIRVLIVA